MSVRRRTWRTPGGQAREAWVVAYTDGGGGRRIATFARKREADAYDAEVRSNVRAGLHTAPSISPTVAEAAAEWLTYIELEGRERSTLDQYRQHISLHINPRLGHERLARLTTPGIHAFRDALLNDLSRPLAKKVLTSLKSLLADAQRRGNVAQNVARPVTITVDKRTQRKLQVGIDIPSPDQVRCILDAAGKFRPFLVVAVFTGLRASELRGLRWSDVDLTRGELTVRQRADHYNVIGPPKSKAGKRAIPFGPLVVNALKRWKLACPKSEYDLVFPSVKGRIAGRDQLADIFHNAQITAGVTTKSGKPKYRGLHALRHFYASWCINRRADGGLELPVKVVQERLGHATIVMTMDTYGHLFPRNDDGKELAAAERALLGVHAT
jgi:integrase